MADNDNDDHEIEREGIQRLMRCREWKSLWNIDLRECYFFATPQRQRMIQSYSPPPMQRLLDMAELNTDVAFELVGDFATEVINTYMPQAQNWCDLEAGPQLPEEAAEEIRPAIKKLVDNVFATMKASNFYAELAKAFDPDLAIGTVGLWIGLGTEAYFTNLRLSE